MAKSSGLFLATIYNQSQLAERKHVARYWSNNTAATAVPLSAHAPLSVSYYNEISGGHIGRAVVRRRCSAGPVLPLWDRGCVKLLSKKVGLRFSYLLPQHNYTWCLMMSGLVSRRFYMPRSAQSSRRFLKLFTEHVHFWTFCCAATNSWILPSGSVTWHSPADKDTPPLWSRDIVTHLRACEEARCTSAVVFEKASTHLAPPTRH